MNVLINGLKEKGRKIDNGIFIQSTKPFFDLIMVCGSPVNIVPSRLRIIIWKLILIRLWYLPWYPTSG